MARHLHRADEARSKSQIIPVPPYKYDIEQAIVGSWTIPKGHKGGMTSIPIAFQDATLLSALAHPDHLLFVGSRGFAHLPPSSILKSNGYNSQLLRGSLLREANADPAVHNGCTVQIYKVELV